MCGFKHVRMCVHACLRVCVCEDMRIDIGGEILDLAGVFPLRGTPPKKVYFKMFVISQNEKTCKNIFLLIPIRLWYKQKCVYTLTGGYISQNRQRIHFIKRCFNNSIKNHEHSSLFHSASPSQKYGNLC